jgi:hypothetical protein
MGPQSQGSLNFGNFKTLKTKCHLDVGFMERHVVRGKMVASTKSRPWWILWIRSCPWFVLASKMLKLCALTNLLFGLYRSMWVIKHLSFFVIPSRNSNTPLYPQSVASQRTCFDSLFFHCFHFKLIFESIKELGSASHKIKIISMGHLDERGSRYIFIIDNFLFKQKQFLIIMSIGA